MKTETIEIVDRGRGPQLSTSRITVLDVFHRLHYGSDWEQIHASMPTLTRAEFDVLLDYINDHRAELIERDRRAEEYREQKIAEQHARGGIFAPPDESMTTEDWVAHFREIVKKKQAEKNREGNPG